MTLPVEPHLLAAFAAASFVLLVIPGPTIIMVISQALAHGRRVAMASVIGVGLGDLAAATASLVGIGAILATSSSAFVVVKWAGAIYLVWIGVKMWRSPVTPMALDLAGKATGERQWPIFRDAFLVTLFNPKGIVFFMAFVPQFITPAHDFAGQAVVLITTFVILGMLNAAAYVWLAGAARQLVRRPAVLGAASRTGAVFLISAGIASLFARRAA